MGLLSLFPFTHIVIINICINGPGHGRSKIGCINGSKNTYLKQKMCMVGIEESNNENTILNAASDICDNNQEFKF